MLALILCCSVIFIPAVAVMWFCTNSYRQPPQSPELPLAPPPPIKHIASE
ncbi:hypothetical protein V6Z11_D05G274200 [Gossypium hirsutum]